MTFEELVDQEHTNQYRLWGEQNHPPEWWSVILGEEKGEIDKAILEARGGIKYSWLPGEIEKEI
ncbi:hypothetical protein LCGC14_2628190, partial [marine sediment metagenome]